MRNKLTGGYPMRRRLSYANVVATLALVFAMSGGAIAANSYLINSTKQINPKVLKKLKGNSGKAGPSGANGGNGATGAIGPQGPGGKEGAPGKEGTPGKEGQKGEPGPFVSAVPSGKTITGGYGFFAKAGGFYGAYVSYPFPLPAEPTAAVFLEVGQTEATHCPGTATAPKAEPGYLCIYRGDAFNAKAGSVLIANNTGARNGKGDVNGFLVEGVPEAEGTVLDEGTWAYQVP
jgi:hypothetical protein